MEHRLQKNFPLHTVTSLGVGGPAQLFFRASSPEDIIWALRWAESRRLPVTLLGYGTNVLVLDGGLAGLCIQLADSFVQISRRENEITASSGCLFSCVAKWAAYQGLAGLEFAVGIPGSLGGAVFMNAGAYDGEIGPLLKTVQWVTTAGAGTWDRAEYTYSYRHSRVQQEGVIVTGATIELEAGDPAAIFGKMKELQDRRRSSQPLEYPNAGSTFKRPPGHYVGPLIEKAGLKGFRVGGAEISTKHCGFIVNTGNATAADILTLMQHIQTTIAAQFGIELQPEIRIIGRQ